MNDDNDSNEFDNAKDRILELCKLAQGNITTIHWCKQQIKKSLKVMDRLVSRLEESKDKSDTNLAKRLETLIHKQTESCKDLGDKIKIEIESLEAIRIASKAYGIDIKTRLFELSDNDAELDSDIDDLFSEK